jgi:diguanylate cyclase (GGDEF)-like protein/PAS domain S-box-containing protein
VNAPTRSILVVDDALDARLVMQAVLQKSGYEVRLAEDGDAALRVFREQPADLVMLDVDMPGRSGYEVCAELRAHAGPLLPIVMVTGLDDMASVQAAYDCGATDFIAKPINWPLIGHRLNYLFRAHETTLSLSAAESQMAAILEALPDHLVELDIEGRIIDAWMPGSASLAGFDGSVVGRNLVDVLPAPAAHVCLAALHAARDEGISSGHQFELPHDGGHSCFELSVSRKAGARGAASHYLVLVRDISARKDAERRIAQLAYFDGLTGLPNRQSFLERVDQRIRHSADRDEQLAVLFIDLDGFKSVNDTLGHKAGDLVLQVAADRLRASLRPTDVLERVSGGPKVELGRLGGDEFTVLLGEIARPEDAVSVAKRLGRAMRQPFEVEGRVLTLDSSIGVAMYPQDGEDGETLLKYADTAMYQAKRAGRGNVELYSAELTERLSRRMALEASLRVALERDEFRLVYQPQVERVSGRVHSVEALLRWHHPERGVVSPLEFIPLAEETDLIDGIGQWVLRTACADAAAWMRAGRPMAVAVNMSAKQFRAASLPEQVLAALAASGLPAQLLELEITESLLMDNTDTARSMLQVLRDHGVRTALDDFGTGYSSLAYLTRMPIGKIKIDRVFVAGLLEGGDSAAIVRAVLAMAESLGMDVTAEGVETREQAQALVAMGCAYLQGYYLSRPVPAADIPAFAGKRWRFDLLESPSTVAVLPGAAQQA